MPIGEEQTGLIITLVLAPLVTVLVLWLRKRLRLVDAPFSDEAATAVKITTKAETKPANRDQALTWLAEKIAQQDAQIRDLEQRDNAWAMFSWELEMWGVEGWSFAPKPHKPMPQRPTRLRPQEPPIPEERPEP